MDRRSAVKMLSLAADECAELFARLLVPHTAVAVLHGEHPVQVPVQFREIVRHPPAGLRDPEAQSAQDDPLTSYVIGTGSDPYKSTCATADLAAVGAIAARCYGECDSRYAQQCLEAAKRAWRWAVAHPDVVFRNPPWIGTGEYGDPHCGDELLWAAAELWRTTGESEYEQAFLAGVKALPPEESVKTPSWGFVAPMAYWRRETCTICWGGTALECRG